MSLQRIQSPNEISKHMSDIFDISPTLIGICGGELQYTEVSDDDLQGAFGELDSKSKLIVLDEVNELMLYSEELFKEFSTNSNIYFSSGAELRDWLNIIKVIVSN